MARISEDATPPSTNSMRLPLLLPHLTPFYYPLVLVACSHTRPFRIHEQAVKARKSSNVCCLSCHDSFYSDGYTTLIITFAVHTNSRRNHRR